MITLLTKNKSQLALDRLLKEADDAGAIPDSFLMTPAEYAAFLREVPILKEDIKKHVKVSMPAHENETFVLHRQILSGKTLTEDEIYKLVEKWVRFEYTIEYKEVPIKRIKKQKKEKATP